MQSRMLGWLTVALAVLLVGRSTPCAAQTAPDSRWVVVNIEEPTRVGSTVLMGRYLIVHDSREMTTGGPCTTIYRFNKNGKGKMVVTFHCSPGQRLSAERATLTFRRAGGRNPLVTRELAEYQFAGDTEAHVIPASTW